MLDHARVLSRLGKMAAGVAHEVRNPLNAMNIHLELLKQKLGDSGGAANQTHVDVVQREIARLERVVYGFLRLARLQELSLKPIDVGPFLRELKELVLPEARMAGVEITLDVAGSLPEIYGDEEVLRQALLNLLRNAIQASPAGSAPIAVSAYPDGQRVRLTVEDCGEGIPVEVQANVFDLYFTTKKEGTGVGLALVQQAVEMHGGSIDMRSKPGLGTAFIITLPAFSGN
jgi:signal transduction histidine kinase